MTAKTAEEIKQRIAEILREEYPEIEAKQIEVITKNFIEGETMKEIDIQTLPARLEKAEKERDRLLREVAAAKKAVALAKKKESATPPRSNADRTLTHLNMSGPSLPSGMYEDAANELVKKYQKEGESFEQAYARVTYENEDARKLVDAALISKANKANEKKFSGMNPLEQPTVADPKKLSNKNQSHQAEAEIHRQVGLIARAEGIEEAQAYSRFLDTPQGKKLYAILVGAGESTEWDDINSI